MTHITQLATVFVPVSDQGAALEFYVNTLGFEQRVDFPYADGERWVEVGPPGALTRITLARAREGRPAGVETGIALDTPDIEAAHAGLKAKGVDVDEAILREGDTPVLWAGAIQAGIPPMFRFRDPDGNSFLLVQQFRE
jgi:catechol 2,3-dioxygenase-like lactoylglutathione lyase family enzyme